MDEKIKQVVDEFALFLSDLRDKYDISDDDFVNIYRHISNCFGNIVIKDKE